MHSEKKSQRFAASGWVVAAMLFGVMVGSGFQTPSLKLATADITKVISESAYGKESRDLQTEMQKVREEILQFIDDYRVLTIEQANRYRELSLKADKSATDKAELERIKAEVIAASKKSQELSTKPQLTPEERTMIDEYARRSQLMTETANRWLTEFKNEVLEFYEQRRAEGFNRAKAAISEIGAKEGYTLVFETSIVPYGANDITNAALAAMNGKGK